MRLACIDIGTNTTRLLVAEPDGSRLRPIQGWRAFTRGGGDWIHGEAIPPAALARLAAEVAHQASIARAAGAQRLRVVATAVVRDAPNGGALIEAVDRACGAAVEVLSHEREARLAFLGASRSQSPAAEGPVAVVDIGGGSTELAVGTADGGADWWHSLALGSATVTDRWLAGDPPSAAELGSAREGVRELFAAVSPPPVRSALAVGGSAATVGSLARGIVDVRGMGRVMAAVLGASSGELAARHGLDPRRARVLAGGALLIEQALGLLGCPLRVGAGGLREGVILEELERG